jgi:hypothetical protein
MYGFKNKTQLKKHIKKVLNANVIIDADYKKTFTATTSSEQSTAFFPI